MLQVDVGQVQTKRPVNSERLGEISWPVSINTFSAVESGRLEPYFVLAV